MSPLRRSSGSGRLASALLGVALLAVLCPAPARAARYGRLSDLERRAVDAALAEIDRVPAAGANGRPVRDLHVFTAEVFGPEHGFMQFFNLLHATSRDIVFVQEQLFEPGEPFEWQKLQDMERNLRNPLFRSVIVVIPVEVEGAGPDDPVDLLVVSRDVWSLRANVDFEFANRTLTHFGVELAENNLAGYNKRVAAYGLYGLDTVTMGLRYVDPRLAWSRLQLTAEHAFRLNHRTWDYEGMSGGATLALPLFSARSRWAASASVGYSTEIFRSYQGDRVRLWDNPLTEDREDHPVIYDWSSVSAQVGATRSFGVDVKHDLSFGYRFATSAASPHGFEGTSEQRQAFVDALLPRTETTSGPTFGYNFYLWKFAQLYDFDTFALLEEVRVGPWVSASVRWASELFGSQAQFATVGVSAGYVACPGNDSYIGLQVGVSGRAQGDLVDRQVSASLRLASPRLFRFARLHAAFAMAWQADNRANRRYVLGGNNGFRGAPPGQLFGENFLRANFELRTFSVPLWLFKVGGVAFYDGGDAFEGRAINWRHATGLGLRVLVLSVNRSVIRFDYGVPLNGERAGFRGGTFTGGFEQAF